MRLLVASIAALVILAGIETARAVAESTLTGSMAPFSYLVGSWNCTTKLPAMMGQPARTEQATVTFEAVPGNAVHDHVTSADYAGDDYFGYNDKMKMYWSSSTDNSGAHGSATSADGKTYTGTSVMGPATMNVTSSYAKVSPTNITLHEVISGGGEQATVDSACTR